MREKISLKLKDETNKWLNIQVNYKENCSGLLLSFMLLFYMTVSKHFTVDLLKILTYEQNTDICRERKEGWLDVLMVGCIDGWMYWWLVGCIVGWMYWWLDVLMVGCVWMKEPKQEEFRFHCCCESLACFVRRCRRHGGGGEGGGDSACGVMGLEEDKVEEKIFKITWSINFYF